MCRWLSCLWAVSAAELGAIHCLCGAHAQALGSRGEGAMDMSDDRAIMARESPKSGHGCPGLWLLSPTQVPHSTCSELSCAHRVPQDFSNTQH